MSASPPSPAPTWSYVRLSPSSLPSCRVLSVCREPVNSMNTQLWRELSEAMRQLEADSSVQAVIIQSTLTRGQHRADSRHPQSNQQYGLDRTTSSLPATTSMSEQLGTSHTATTQAEWRAEQLISIRLTLCCAALPYRRCCRLCWLCVDHCRLYAKSASRTLSTSAERYSDFWRLQTECLARLYRSRLLCVAAIRGSCPAGGCILALCCDYRVMTRDGSIGLNEAALSIPVPEYWMTVMSRTVGWRTTEALLQKGQLLPAQQALQIGLVDELVDDKSMLLGAAEKEAATRLTVPAAGRAASKRIMRDALSQQWEAQWRSEADQSWKLLSSEETMKQLGRVLQRLSANKNAQQPPRQAKL